MKITYFNDGGHGWYSVKRSKLASMGVLGKVSGFYVLNQETKVMTKVRAIRGVESNVVMNNALFNKAMKLAA